MTSVVEKIIFMPNQCYDAPSSKVGKRFVGILSIEIDGVCARKWYANRVIFFNPLSSNMHKVLIIPRKFESAFCFNSICRFVEHLTSL